MKHEILSLKQYSREVKTLPHYILNEEEYNSSREYKSAEISNTSITGISKYSLRVSLGNSYYYSHQNMWA
ncbi:unnamed protein product [Moneuplotes crassus]|uniref:Uncharacterized protein n=1 Tax=Euplotes crassus TaxID=5936 RepID=A0AAD2D9F8_EUPCR|nr:unnamed protein product [Moneuplotes crassus]